MMKSTQIVLLMVLLTAVGAARIYPWGEPYIQYPNKGLIDNINLFFSLETKLPAGHALRIRLPFSTAPNLSGVVVYPQTSTRGTVTTPSSGTIAGYQYSAKSVSPFDMYYYFASDLSAGTNYVLKLSFATKPTDVGWLGYVQLETMSPAASLMPSSSSSDVPITYDLNNAFAPIHIFNQPGIPTFSLGNTEASAQTTTAAATYVQPLKLQLSNDFWFWPTIVISWSGSAGFSFGQCVSADIGVNTTAIPLPSSRYTCTVSSTAQTITINHNDQINKTQNIVYNVSITNPKNGGSTTLSVMVYHRFNLNVTDNNPSAITLNVNAPSGSSTSTAVTLSAVRVLLSWGIDRRNGATTLLQNVFQIYASTLSDATITFQGLRFQFDLSNTLPSGTYQVTLNLCSGSSICWILENSVDHNLGSNVVCTASNPSSGNVKVTCPGVTSLQLTNNAIGVRVFFATTAVSSNAINDGQFGQISIDSLASSGSYTSYITAIALDTSYKAAKSVQTTSLPILANVNGNGPLFGTTDSNAWNAITGSSGVTAYGAGTVTGGSIKLTGGIFVSTNANPPAMNLALLTSIRGTTDDYSGGSSKNVFGVTNSNLPAGSGVDMFLNPYLWSIPSSTVDKSTCWARNQGYKDGSAHTPTTGAHCYSVANSSTSNWVRLRFVFTVLATSANVDSTTNKLLGFYWPGFVQQKSQYAGTSLKADTNVADYYAAFYYANSLTNLAATTSGASVSDAGDLGGTNLTSTVVPNTITSIVWSQYFLAPFSVSGAFAVTSVYTSMTVWLSSWSNTGSTPSYGSNDAVTMIRARGQTVTADPVPSTAKLALFFRITSSTLSTGFLAVGPAGTTTTTNTFTCFTSSAGNKCYLDRTGRQTPTALSLAGNSGYGKAINYLDLYQAISTDAVFTTASTQTLVMVTDFLYTTTAGNIPIPRLGWVVSSGTYYLNPEDNAFANIGASTVTLVQTTPSCSGTTTTPKIGPSVGQSTQIVSQSNSVIQLNYMVSNSGDAITATNGYGNIVWCAQWNFQGSSFGFSNTSGLESTSLNDKCVAFNYRSIASTNTNWYCIYCPISTSAGSPPTTTSRSFNLTNFVSANAVTILQPSWGTISADSGLLLEKSSCATWSSAFTAGTATGSSTGSAFGQIGQKVVISVTLASTIAGIDTIVIEGRQNTSTSSIDSTFPQATIDTNAECWLVSTSDPSISNYLNIPCPSSPSGSLTFSSISVASPKDVQNGWQIIVWGLTGNTAPTTPPTSLYFMIKSQRSGALVDQSASATLSNLITWPIISASNNFTILSPLYTRGVLNSRGTFRWDFSFPSTRPMYYKDSVVFSLDAITTASQNNNANILKCRITDNVGVVNQNFRACTFSSSVTPATLTVISLPRSITVVIGQTVSFAVFDFVMSGVRVHLDGVQALALQSIKTIYGKVFFGGINGGSAISLTKDSTASDLAAPVDVSTKGFPLNYPVVNKYWAAPGSFGDIAFTLISNVPFNETCRITIEFPTYYNPGLSTRSQAPFCSIDGANTHCQVSGPRTLQIDGFPAAKTANTPFIIRVSGISAPSITTADNFWIQLNQDLSDSANTIIYAGAISETIIASQTIVPFHVNWMNVTTAPTRTSTTFTWTCNALGSQNYTTNHSVHVLFPPSWGLSWNVFTPTCQVVDYASQNTIYSAAQTIVGDNVFMNLQTTLPQSQIVNIVCQNVRTPDTDTTYFSQDIQIRIVDQAGTTIFQHSAPSVHNTNFGYQFQKSSTLSYVNWDQTTSSSITSPISLPRGTFGASLLLNMPARSLKNFLITPTPSTFAFSPSPFNVSTGQTSVRAFIGCAQNTPINNYAVLFTLSDVSTYTSPPISYFSVNMNKVSLTMTSGPISVLFVQGTVVRSYPVTIDSSANPPFADITVTPTAPANANFTVSPSAVTLTPTNPWAQIVFATTPSTLSGESDSFSFVLAGTNANAFNVPANLVVTATPDTTNQAINTPTLTITADGSDQSKATTKTLSLNLGGGVTYATAYIGCQVAGTWTLGDSALQAAATQQLPFNPSDPVQGQYFSVVLTKAQTSQLVSNFRPNSFYECRGFVVSQTNRTSTPQAVFSFKTASNGGSIIRWLFNHITYPTATQRQKLLCTLTQTLGVPAGKVVAVTGEICGNTTAFYSVSNSSGSLAVYFYPLDLETDSVITVANLQASLNTTTNLNALNNTVVSGDSPGAPILSILPDGIVSVSKLKPEFPQSTSFGSTYAAVSGIVLNDTGYVFAAIATNTTTAPSGLSLKVAAASNSSSAYGGVQVGYYSLGGTPLTFNFTSLNPATSYTLYLVGTNNDPTFQCNFTDVSAVPVTTVALPSTPVSAMALFTSLLAIVVSMLALQLI